MISILAHDACQVAHSYSYGLWWWAAIYTLGAGFSWWSFWKTEKCPLPASAPWLCGSSWFLLSCGATTLRITDFHWHSVVFFNVICPHNLCDLPVNHDLWTGHPSCKDCWKWACFGLSWKSLQHKIPNYSHYERQVGYKFESYGTIQSHNGKRQLRLAKCFTFLHTVPSIHLSRRERNGREWEAGGQRRRGGDRGGWRKEIISSCLYFYGLISHTSEETRQIQLPFFVNTVIIQSLVSPKLLSNRGHGFVNTISVYLLKGSTSMLSVTLSGPGKITSLW